MKLFRWANKRNRLIEMSLDYLGIRIDTVNRIHTERIGRCESEIEELRRKFDEVTCALGLRISKLEDGMMENPVYEPCLSVTCCESRLDGLEESEFEQIVRSKGVEERLKELEDGLKKRTGRKNG